MPLTHFRSLTLNHSKTSSLHKTSRASLVLKPAVTPPTSEKEAISRYSSYYRDSDATDISSIPVELLQEIFLLAFDPAQVADHPRGPPFNLSQTCRLWRDLAINIPSLWNVVPVVPAISPHLLQQWIARSQRLPLVLHVLTFYVDCDHPPQTRVREAAIFDILHSCAARWEELYLYVLSPHSHGHFLSLPPSSFGSLKRVHWSNPIDRPAESFERFWRLARNIPTIQDVRLIRIPQEGPWSQIAQLHLTNSNFDCIMRILRHCRNLATLYLDDVKMPPQLAGVIPVPPIALPKLTDLRLYLSYGEDILLDCLNLPSLRRMRYEIDFARVLPSIGSLLRRSGANLEELQLSGIHDRKLDHAIPFLKQPCFDQLASLIIGVISPDSAFWEEMKNTTFLPSLQSLCWRVPLYLGRSFVREALEERILSGTFTGVTLQATCWCRQSASCDCDKAHEVLRSQLSDLIDVRIQKAGEKHSSCI